MKNFKNDDYQLEVKKIIIIYPESYSLISPHFYLIVYNLDPEHKLQPISSSQ